MQQKEGRHVGSVLRPNNPIRVFKAHELLDPWGIKRCGEMQVVLKADYDRVLEEARQAMDTGSLSKIRAALQGVAEEREITRYAVYAKQQLGKDAFVWREEDTDGKYVLFEECEQRERLLTDALRVAKDFIEDLQLPDAEWEQALDKVVAALATVKPQETKA